MSSTPLRIEHVALYTADLEATRDFFERYFHATGGPLYHNPTKQFRSYFLTFPGGSARLEIMTRPALLPSATADSLGYAHIALSVGSPAEVDALTDRLRRDGYAVLSGPRTTGDGYYESVVAAVGGLTIEITV